MILANHGQVKGYQQAGLPPRAIYSFSLLKFLTPVLGNAQRQGQVIFLGPIVDRTTGTVATASSHGYLAPERNSFTSIISFNPYSNLEGRWYHCF